MRGFFGPGINILHNTLTRQKIEWAFKNVAVQAMLPYGTV